jgi:hypothetical protein
MYEKIIFRSILYHSYHCNKSENIAKQEVRADPTEIFQEDKVALSSPVASYASQPSRKLRQKTKLHLQHKN